MQKPLVEIRAISANLIKIKGDLIFNNAVLARKQGIKVLDSVSSAKIDLAELNNIDSSCLSILVTFIRHAKLKHKTIEFINLPEKLINLSRVCGVDEILPIAY